jgi:4'-phosphopantetheinyl transferase
MSAIRLFHWPEMPALPPPGQPVLVKVDTGASRPAARQKLRENVQRILSAWSGSASQSPSWRETPCGPIWPDRTGGLSVAVSFSYSDNTEWIGLVRGGLIGVDATPACPFSEMEEVALLYLGPASAAAIRAAVNPAHAFAIAWTGWEAQLKCQGRSLTEWPGAPVASAIRFTGRQTHVQDDVVVSVVTAEPQTFWSRQAGWRETRKTTEPRIGNWLTCSGGL